MTENWEKICVKLFQTLELGGQFSLFKSIFQFGKVMEFSNSIYWDSPEIILSQ